MHRHIYIHLHRTRDAFVSSEHPRGQPSNSGEFVAKGTGGAATKASAPPKTKSTQSTTTPAKSASSSHLPGAKKQRETLTEFPEDRAQLPDHIRKLRVPPAWTNKKYNPDPNGHKLVEGYDVKGRRQSLYSTKFTEGRKADKFKRVKKIATKMEQFSTKNNKNLNARDQSIRQHAEALGLIMETGIRPGSERNTGADVHAYGITNMQGQHVISEGNKTYLRFTGKKGVHQNLEIENKQLADSLRDRAKRVGANNKIFPSIDDNSLRRYSQSITNGLANPKDFRTLLGTKLAADKIKAMEKPTTKSGLKKAMKEVAELVSGKLGNTPAIAMASYISPYVWEAWK
jgi:DNA topoisomerase-1